MTEQTGEIALSIVIPVYNGAKTIGPLVDALSLLEVEGGHEIIFGRHGLALSQLPTSIGPASNDSLPTSSDAGRLQQLLDYRSLHDNSITSRVCEL